MKVILQVLFGLTTILFPIAMALTAWIKKEFMLSGKSAKIASYIISLLIVVFYGVVIVTLPIWQIVVLYLMVAVSHLI